MDSDLDADDVLVSICLRTLPGDDASGDFIATIACQYSGESVFGLIFLLYPGTSILQSMGTAI